MAQEKRKIPSRNKIADKILTHAGGFKESVIILTANQLGIFELVATGGMSAADVAKKLRLNREAVEILLNALAGAGWLRKRAGSFSLTPEYQPYLAKDGSHFLGDIMRHNYNVMHSWIRLADVAREGRQELPAEEARLGDPELLDAFIRGMSNVSRLELADVFKVVNPKKFRAMVDLGGGPGTAAMEFCRRNPAMTAIIFDHGPVLDIALEEISRAGMADRIWTMPGDFTVEVPLKDLDLVYASNVIHSYSLKENLAVFRRCRRVLQPGGTIIVKDFFVDDSRTRPAENAIFAINMLVNTRGGMAFTAGEIKGALEKAGFVKPRFRQVNERTGLIIAKRD